MTTFDLDLKYLEQTLLPTLVGLDADAPDREAPPANRRTSSFLLELRKRLQAAQIAVLADKHRFEFDTEKTFETYDLFFAETGGAFHPKIHIIAFDRDLRVIVSSANLTMAGFHRNLEVFWMASTEQGDHFGSVARDTIDFLGKLHRKYWSSSRSLARILRFLRQQLPRSKGEARMLNSESPKSLVNQWCSQMRGHPEELHVITPFFDRGERLRLFERFRGAKFHLYVLEHKIGGKPIYRVQISKRALERIQPNCWIIRPDWVASMKGDEEEVFPRTLHGKCYAARYKDKGALLLGSPNFTANAFFGRNTEAAVTLEGPWRKIERFLPPTRSESLDWRLLTISTPSDDPVSNRWTPFLEMAEYNAGTQMIHLCFAPRLSVGKWSVIYEETKLASGKRYPGKLRCPMKLGTKAFLLLREGRHIAKFPFSVVEKELLPTLPGLAELDYNDILELLASGISNLVKFQERVQDRQSKKASSIMVDEVPQMEWLRRVTLALEGLRKRLQSSVLSVGEARALFQGDLGVMRILKGIHEDERLDSTLRIFALLEIGALLASVRWKGVADGKREAQRNAKKARKLIRQWTRGTLPVCEYYYRYGRLGWSR
jgi:hypothetical protein